METTGIDGHNGIRARKSFVIQLETEDESSTGQDQTKQTADRVLKSLSPLINSMRLFGLYFTRERYVRVASETMSSQSIRRCQRWNAARIYATFILAVIWLNAARNCMVFNGKETVGADLFKKLVIIPRDLLIAILHTAYYVASHTGSLERVFGQVRLSMADFSSKYTLMAKVMTVVCWTLVTFNVGYYVYPIFNRGYLNDLSVIVFIDTFRIPKPYADVMMGVCVVLQQQSAASWIFTQAMKLISIDFYNFTNHDIGYSCRITEGQSSLRGSSLHFATGIRYFGFNV